MKLKQISVFLENRDGAIMELTRILTEAKINIRALSMGDTADFGVIRLIVSDAAAARDKLKEAGFVVNVTDVIGVNMADAPGAFHQVVKVLFDEKISIEYSYAFLSPVSAGAYVILRVQDGDRAIEVLQTAGMRLMSDDEL